MCGVFHIVFGATGSTRKRKSLCLILVVLFDMQRIPLCKDIPPEPSRASNQFAISRVLVKVILLARLERVYFHNFEYCDAFQVFPVFKNTIFWFLLKPLLPTPKNESIIINQKWNFRSYTMLDRKTRGRERNCWFEDMPSRPDAIPLSTATSHSFFLYDV
jgi:hypothetical protein